MDEKKIEFIKREILKSGFPLELELSSILRNRDYEVTCNQYFFDNDEKKAREFDIEAVLPTTKLFFSEVDLENPWYFNPFLLVECKKSLVYSWVFFKSEPVAGWFDIGHSIDVLTNKSGYLNSICGQLLREVSLHYNKMHANIVSTYQQVKIQKLSKDALSSKDAILDAKSKIIKFINYRFQNLQRFFSPESNRRDILFYFPLIVFDGVLFEASFGKTLELNEAKHLIYETRYLSNLTQSLVPLYIDVIRKDAFEEILSIIEKETFDIHKYLQNAEAQKHLSSIFQDAIT